MLITDFIKGFEHDLVYIAKWSVSQLNSSSVELESCLVRQFCKNGIQEGLFKIDVIISTQNVEMSAKLLIVFFKIFRQK